MIRDWFSLLLICLIPNALAQNEPNDSPDGYRYLMQVHVAHEGGQHRLMLPAEVYLHAEQAGLADLRLFNGSRESLPYAFSGEPAEPPAQPGQQMLNWFALTDNNTTNAQNNGHLSVQLQPDGTLNASRTLSPPQTSQIRQYLIDASTLQQPAQALEIEANDGNDNQLRHLTIAGSDDLNSWHTLTDHAPWLNLHSGEVQLTRKRVEFSPSRYKYYRLSWDDQPAKLEKVTVETLAATTTEKFLQHTLQIRQSKPESADYQFELPAALYIERWRLLLPQADSVASVRLFSRRSESDPWLAATSATFYRINRDQSEISSPALPLLSLRDRYWRIHLDRYSSELPATLQLEIGWHPHQLVFLASGSAPYTLAFGKHKAKPGSFSLATLLPGYRSGDELTLPLANTGKLVSRELSNHPDSFMERHELDIKTLTLWAILILGVTLLGWMAWHIKKGLNEE